MICNTVQTEAAKIPIALRTTDRNSETPITFVALVSRGLILSLKEF